MNLETAIKGLPSDKPEIVIACLKYIGQEGKLPNLQQILGIVKHTNVLVKKAAIDASVMLIRTNLASHFHELNADVRKKLGTMLESLDPLIIDELSTDLYCDDEVRRLRTVQILGLLSKNPKLKEVLAKLIQDRDVKIRATAVNLLGKISGLEDQDLVMALLSDKDKRVRANTVEALESLGNKRLVPLLQRFRKDPSNRIRGNIVKALYNLGFKEIDDDIMDMLSSTDEFMQATGLWCVTQLKVPSKKIEDQSGMLLLAENEMVATNALKAMTALNTPKSLGYLRYLQSV